MKLEMPMKSGTLAAGAAFCLALFACTAGPAVRDQASAPHVPISSGTTDDRRLLAGEWEYEDGAVVTLTLDERGNGTYSWKEGRFETTVLADHTWNGMWFQKENDREGEFSVKFSSDFSEGDGRWWYTRIGTDHAPKQQGGTFHLSRKMRGTDTAVVPPSP